MRSLPPLLLGLLVAALALPCGCATMRNSPTDIEFDSAQPGVAFSSQPPGAEVWIDGNFSGFCTPCVLEIDPDSRCEVELRLLGYESVERRLEPHGEWSMIPWREGDTYPTHWRFPLLLTMGGFLVPLRRDTDLWPSRLHARLRLSTQS
jgi:hypothetical protein